MDSVALQARKTTPLRKGCAWSRHGGAQVCGTGGGGKSEAQPFRPFFAQRDYLVSTVLTLGADPVMTRVAPQEWVKLVPFQLSGLTIRLKMCNLPRGFPRVAVVAISWNGTR